MTFPEMDKATRFKVVILPIIEFVAVPLIAWGIYIARLCGFDIRSFAQEAGGNHTPSDPNALLIFALVLSIAAGPLLAVKLYRNLSLFKNGKRLSARFVGHSKSKNGIVNITCAYTIDGKEYKTQCRMSAAKAMDLTATTRFQVIVSTTNPKNSILLPHVLLTA